MFHNIHNFRGFTLRLKPQPKKPDHASPSVTATASKGKTTYFLKLFIDFDTELKERIDRLYKRAFKPDYVDAMNHFYTKIDRLHYESRVYERIKTEIRNRNLSPHFVEWYGTIITTVHEIYDVFNIPNNNLTLWNRIKSTVPELTRFNVNLSRNNFPIKIIVTEAIEDSLSLHGYLDSSYFGDKKVAVFGKLIMQLIAAVYILRSVVGVHNDLHFGNIMVHKTTTDLAYMSATRPNHGWLFNTYVVLKLFDFDRSSMDFHRNTFIKDVEEFGQTSNITWTKDMAKIMCEMSRYSEFNHLTLQLIDDITTQTPAGEFVRHLIHNSTDEKCSKLRLPDIKTRYYKSTKGDRLGQTTESVFWDDRRSKGAFLSADEILDIVATKYSLSTITVSDTFKYTLELPRWRRIQHTYFFLKPSTTSVRTATEPYTFSPKNVVTYIDEDKQSTKSPEVSTVAHQPSPQADVDMADPTDPTPSPTKKTDRIPMYTKSTKYTKPRGQSARKRTIQISHPISARDALVDQFQNIGLYDDNVSETSETEPNLNRNTLNTKRRRMTDRAISNRGSCRRHMTIFYDAGIQRVLDTMDRHLRKKHSLKKINS